MSYELREHTADVAIEARGDTLGEAFAAAADGLTAAQCDDVPDNGDRFPFEERAESCEALLFELLDRLIYERDVRSVLPAAHEIEVAREGTEWIASGSALGVPLADVRAREVKAVTYSEMVIEETDAGWHVYVVLDV